MNASNVLEDRYLRFHYRVRDAIWAHFMATHPWISLLLRREVIAPNSHPNGRDGHVLMRAVRSHHTRAPVQHYASKSSSSLELCLLFHTLCVAAVPLVAIPLHLASAAVRGSACSLACCFCCSWLLFVLQYSPYLPPGGRPSRDRTRRCDRLISVLRFTARPLSHQHRSHRPSSLSRAAAGRTTSRSTIVMTGSGSWCSCSLQCSHRLPVVWGVIIAPRIKP